MITNFLLKKKINPTFYSSNIKFWKKKENNPPTQPCALINSNMKLLKTPNSFTTLEYP
jgi:hypothetical protein